MESDLPADSNRFLIAPDMGALESPVVGEFARAMEEVTRSDAYQAAYLWAQVGVSLPGEAGLMTASMIPGVGEGMDAHALATSESRMERWIAGTSLGLSGITLGVAPNFGRFARFIGDMANAGTRRGVQAMSRVADAVSDGSARMMREASTAGTALRRTGQELTADARVFGRAYWQSAHVLGVVPQDPLLAGVRAVQSRRALGSAADEVTGLGNVLGTTSNALNRLLAPENAADIASKIGPRKLPATDNPWRAYQVHVTGKNFEEMWHLNTQRIAADSRNSGFFVEAKWTGKNAAAWRSSPYNPASRYYDEAKILSQAGGYLRLNAASGGLGVRYAVSNEAARAHFESLFRRHFGAALDNGSLNVWHVPGTGM